MQIVPLSAEHELALRDFLEDFVRVGESDVPGYFADASWSHDEIVANLAAGSRGEHLPEGWVPSTTSFLEDDGEILCVVNLRHRLTGPLLRCGGHVGYGVRPSARGRGHATRMLESAKQQARELGIDRILVTCDTDNRASTCVIEKCGGVLYDVLDGASGGTIRRYWIAL